MIGGLGQISETEKSMAQINRHDDGTPLVITSDIKPHCVWNRVRGECFKKKNEQCKNSREGIN